MIMITIIIIIIWNVMGTKYMKTDPTSYNITLILKILTPLIKSYKNNIICTQFIMDDCIF